MKTLLCCIGRNENQYIREWVEYNKNIGFTNICLYDNNYDGEEHFEEVIGDYIESGFVILKDYRNKKICQLNAYNECYAEYNNEYDWIAFFDCDEFLTFAKDKTIEEYLNRPIFRPFNGIKVNWMCYGDNGQLYYENRPVLERFTTPIPFDKNIAYDFPEDYHIKSILRGRFLNVKFKANPHIANMSKMCNASGIKVHNDFSPFSKTDFDLAYLRHYSTKTVEEYCNKMLRGFPDHIINQDKIKGYLETRFFKYNKVTQEKIDIVKDKLGIDMGYLEIEKEDIVKHIDKSSDVKLFMLCYNKKDYDFLDDKVITPLQCGAETNSDDVCELKDNTGDNISDRNYFFAENTGIYWIWRNVKNAKYKGQMQYRRRLPGINENTDFDKIFENYDVICAKPYNYPKNFDYIPAKTVSGGYRFSHCGEDLYKMELVIKKLYPEYTDSWKKYILNGENLYYSSGFILPAEKYDEYCGFLFSCLNEWLRINNISNRDDLLIHVARDIGAGKYIRFSDEERMVVSAQSVKWLSLIGGFLGERLWTLWLLHNYSPDRIYELEYDKIENTRI